MAATQYQIFYRYFNPSVNKPITNQTEYVLIGKEEFKELKEFYTIHREEYEELDRSLRGVSGAELRRLQEFNANEQNIYNKCTQYLSYINAKNNDVACEETIIVEPMDSLYQDDANQTKRKAKMARDLKFFDILSAEAYTENPKFDMIFCYDGIGREDASFMSINNDTVTFVPSINGSYDYNPDPDKEYTAPYVYYDKMKRLNISPWFLHSTHGSLLSAMEKAKELVNIVGKDCVKIGKVVNLDKYIEIV